MAENTVAVAPEADENVEQVQGGSAAAEKEQEGEPEADKKGADGTSEGHEEPQASSDEATLEQGEDTETTGGITEPSEQQEEKGSTEEPTGETTNVKDTEKQEGQANTVGVGLNAEEQPKEEEETQGEASLPDSHGEVEKHEEEPVEKVWVSNHCISRQLLCWMSVLRNP